MSNDKQETPVEWYIEKLLDLDYEYAKGLITLGVWSERKKSLIEQAKEMQKQRMIEFAKKFIDVVNIEDKDIENIYEQTYGGGEQ